MVDQRVFLEQQLFGLRASHYESHQPDLDA